jgi:glycosyltransferase involved in cell wall biosynthesis
MIGDRIRVIFLIFSFDIEAVGGGISQFVVNLSRELDPSKFQIIICGLWDRGTEVEARRVNELNQAGIEAFTCSAWDERHPYKAFINSYRILKRYLRKNPVDIMHSHSLFGDIAALWLNFEGKAPIILRTLHNELRTEWSRKPLRRLLLTNLLYPLEFRTEIGVSQFIVENLDQRWLAKKLGRQAIMIHNAVDLDRFSRPLLDHNKTRREIGIPENAFLIGSVGRLTRQKGYDVLLEAVATVMIHIPELHLVLIGDGEDANALRQKASDLKIESKTIFTGPRSDVANLLDMFDLFVCSSRWEGFSTVVMEAMAAGIPILTTDIPGNRELVQPGISAWFAEPEDSQSLADSLLLAYRNPEKSMSYAEKAKSIVKSFGIKEIAKLHFKLYQMILEDRSQSNWLNHRRADSRLKNAINPS